ncbi:hypothetical protein [Nocardia sp. NPDC049707]
MSNFEWRARLPTPSTCPLQLREFCHSIFLIVVDGVCSSLSAAELFGSMR